MESSERPTVGIGVMIFKDGKVLLAQRKSAHGSGEFAFPGGHLEYGESVAECARRETREECGIEIEHIRFHFLANVLKYIPKHYVHIGVIADWKNGEPKILEPEKQEYWNWYALDALPDPLFEMCRLAVTSFKTGTLFFDSV